MIVSFDLDGTLIENWFDTKPGFPILQELAKQLVEGKQNTVYVITAAFREDEEKWGKEGLMRIKQERFAKTGLDPAKVHLILVVGEGYEDCGRRKAETCKSLGVDLMIEDNDKFAQAIANVGTTSLLIVRPQEVKDQAQA